jgi:hypothetical protein
MLARENDKSAETWKCATSYVLHSTVLEAAGFGDGSRETVMKPGKTSLIARARCRIMYYNITGVSKELVTWVHAYILR